MRRLAPDLDDTKSIHSAASEPPHRVLVPGNVPVGLALVVRLAKEAQDVGLGHALFNRGHKLVVEGSATLQAGSSERLKDPELGRPSNGFSLGRFTTSNEVDRAVKLVVRAYAIFCGNL